MLLIITCFQEINFNLGCGRVDPSVQIIQIIIYIAYVHFKASLENVIIDIRLYAKCFIFTCRLYGQLQESYNYNVKLLLILKGLFPVL